MPIFTFSSPLWPCDSHNWGGAERDPGGPQRLAWFMAGQQRRRCDLLRFAEHPRCAGRSVERELVTRCIRRATGAPAARRQDPLFMSSPLPNNISLLCPSSHTPSEFLDHVRRPTATSPRTPDPESSASTPGSATDTDRTP